MKVLLFLVCKERKKLAYLYLGFQLCVCVYVCCLTEKGLNNKQERLQALYCKIGEEVAII